MLNQLYTVCYTLTTATERFLSYTLVSLFRRVLQPLLQHDPEHFQELLSLSIRSVSVSLSLYRRPHSYLIVILHVPETLVSKKTCMDIFHINKCNFPFLGMHLFLFF
uniref:Uncharacterized protein n=1 Tax=Brassica oleracea var. oleracea TaxID=109376 RepID=A0A0D3DD34_BRAOL